MRQKLIQIVGLAVSVLYAGVIVWLFATEPRSFKEVASRPRREESQIAANQVFNTLFSTENH